jgi:phospholipid/cholesterol/gamma-HCH transport system substrate-binding protein
MNPGGWKATLAKFTAFAVVMALLTAFLFFIFGQYTTGSTNDYSAVFTDASRLEPGDTVRVAGIRVGTVNDVALRDDKKVVVNFDAERTIKLTNGTRAMVRYLNLVGDRYLELVDGPGSTKLLSPGAQIPMDRTAGALDLDLLLGGLKPVIQGLNPDDVNQLSQALVQIFQGQEDTLDSLLSKTSSFSTTIADNSQVVQQLIDNLNTVVGTLSQDGDKFKDAVDRLQHLLTDLSADRDPIGDAIVALDNRCSTTARVISTPSCSDCPRTTGS